MEGSLSLYQVGFGTNSTTAYMVCIKLESVLFTSYLVKVNRNL